jgi:hypothetical protein
VNIVLSPERLSAAPIVSLALRSHSFPSAVAVVNTDHEAIFLDRGVISPGDEVEERTGADNVGDPNAKIHQNRDHGGSDETGPEILIGGVDGKPSDDLAQTEPLDGHDGRCINRAPHNQIGGERKSAEPIAHGSVVPTAIEEYEVRPCAKLTPSPAIVPITTMTASKRSFPSSLAFMPSPPPPAAPGDQPASDIIAPGVRAITPHPDRTPCAR